LKKYLTYQLLTRKLSAVDPKNAQPVKPARGGTSLAKEAYGALLTTADVVRTSYEPIWAPYDLTRQQYNVLRILRGAESEGLPTLTIAERMIERTPGVTRIVDRLEAKGLVGREVRPGDRRFVYCRITEKGLQLLDALDEIVDEANRAAFGGLSDSELAELVVLLDRVRRAHAAPAEEDEES
jgi:DNA-binding MarR family transcriptional regulator